MEMGSSGHIAVIGMAGKFPGARDVDELWQNLVAGVESITFFNDDELRTAGVSEERLADPNYVKAAPLSPDTELFDPGYFGMTVREAEVLDPQHRAFLEACDGSLQSAGYAPSSFSGRIGVYGGVGINTYLDLYVKPNPDAYKLLGGLTANIANISDYVATGVAYRLGLEGPALTCLTACSTSLVALHLACQALRNGECEMALAGGVEEFFPEISGYMYSEGGMYSPDGRCRAFDAKARGTIFGSGSGAVLLKPLEAALEDRDNISGIIRSTAINNDGSQKGAFSAPSPAGQYAAVMDAWNKSGVDPSTVSYVEAHGTGTFVGDPIEVNALSRAFRAHTDRKQYCAIGSVKTNVGHLGAAAGVVGLIKTLMSMRHRILPPSLNFDEPNPQIDFDASPLYVNTELSPWTSDSGPLRAGLSSFGVGGTNAHVVLEEPPALPAATPPARDHQLIVLSARTPTALESSATALGEHLREHQDELPDAAYTLAVGREQRAVRGYLVAEGAEAAADRLAAGVPQPSPALVPARDTERSVVFLFPGQGAQYVQMGRELYEREPVFAAELDSCAKVLAEHTGWDLREVLHPVDEGEVERATERLKQTEVTQPALFVFSYALARLLESWGVRPEASAGHSVGEFVAASLAGVFSRDDALRLVADRGRLMQGLPSGSMLSVPLAEDALRPMLPDDVSVAAVNAPHATVVSGPDESVEDLRALLSSQGVEGRLLHTSHAFHSSMMDPILDDFRSLVAGVERHEPASPFVSNVTGTWITPEDAVDPDYWARHLRGAVRFGDTVALLAEGGKRVLMEVGPGNTLTVLARQQLGSERAGLAVPTVRHVKQRQSDVAVLLGAVGQAWQTGVPLDLGTLWNGERRGRIQLPPVPHEKIRCWLDAKPGAAGGEAGALEAAASAETGPYYVPSWREQTLLGGVTVDTEATWLVYESETAPVTGLVERLRAAGATTYVVRAGSAFGRDGEYGFTVRPRELADHIEVFGAITATGPSSLRVVHGWLVGDIPGETPRERARTGLDIGFFSILTAVHAVTRKLVNTPLDLVLLTSDAEPVTGGERIEPVKSGVLGFAKLLPKELADTRCRAVDVTRDGVPGTQIGQILREIAHGDDERVVYRGGRRWVWEHQEVALLPAGEGARFLRDGAVYLITGGLGGIGLVTAKDLARKHAAKLVLLGRNGLPPRAEWDDHLAADEGKDATSERIEAVREVEALGGEVLVCAADVTDPEQLRAVRAEAESAFGKIDVVLHAAGVTGGGMLETRSQADAERVMAAKVFGTLALEEVFADDVDALVLYSTFAIFTGDFGLGDYVSANAIMDAYAHARAARGGSTHVVAVNWPIWQGLGMADQVDAPDLLLDFEMGDRYQEVAHPLLGSRLIRAGNDNTIFVKRLSTDDWVTAEHTVADRPTMPGTSLIEMVRAAYQEATGSPTCSITNLVFQRPLSFDTSHSVHILLVPEGAERFTVVIRDADNDDGPVLDYTTAKVGPPASTPAPVHPLDEWRAHCSNPDEGERLEKSEGLVWLGDRWDNIAGHWRSDLAEGGRFDELATLELAEKYRADLDDFLAHPAVLDCATSIAQHIIGTGEGSYLPFGYDKIVVRAPLPARVHSRIQHLDDTKGSLVRTNVTVVDDQGNELIAIEGFTLIAVGGADALQAAAADTSSASAVPSQGAAQGGSSVDVGKQLELALLRVNEREFGIRAEDGYPMLWDLFDSAVAPQLIICPDSFTRRLGFAKEVTRDALREQLAAAPQRTVTASPRNLATPYVEAETEAQRVIAEMWAETLAVDAIGIDDDFFDLNGNSLVAVQLVARIRERFDVDIAVASLFEARTIRGLAQEIENSLQALIEGLSEEGAASKLAANAN
ncbi:SDR family NAD(P)-dependent oxidoreductase [Streptomyces iconiensis]|uniref:SDR family NAD(P)-dependent oxidoreductase n=1 Tax=Streptomyces iconiensis TaxID=1384038 RepID=A0ABT7A3T3_9ACTN|nr:type I polyketide synthase [Streptomyces iconiensis]MDJ1136009.1 SDR family NAD(P)-dependent oxidoreductase [Streptomyces iconiensis]